MMLFNNIDIFNTNCRAQVLVSPTIPSMKIKERYNWSDIYHVFRKAGGEYQTSHILSDVNIKGFQ